MNQPCTTQAAALHLHRLGLGFQEPHAFAQQPSFAMSLPPTSETLDKLLECNAAVVHSEADAERLRAMDLFGDQPIHVDPDLAPLPGMILGNNLGAVVPTQLAAEKLDALGGGPPGTYLAKPIQVCDELVSEIERPQSIDLVSSVSSTGSSPKKSNKWTRRISFPKKASLKKTLSLGKKRADRTAWFLKLDTC